MLAKIIAAVVTAYILWNTFVRSVHVPGGLAIYTWSYSNARAQFSKRYNIPDDRIVTWQKQGHARTPTTDFWSMDTLTARPVSGDHIHMAMSIWINGLPRQAEHDRPYEEDIPCEQKEQTCREPGNIAYTKLWPHAGVHTHCDGIIHVHPWSAPAVLRREGRFVTLGMWFDQVGIEYRRQGMGFKTGERYDNNATHTWRLAEYNCFHHSVYKLYTQQFDRIWLGNAYGSYVLWYGPVERNKPPLAIKEHIETLQRWGAHGFDGQPYPQRCI